MRAFWLLAWSCTFVGSLLAQDPTADRIKALEDALRAERDRNDSQAKRLQELELTLSSVLSAQADEARGEKLEQEIQRVIDETVDERISSLRSAGSGDSTKLSISGQMRFVARFFSGASVSTDTSFELEHLIIQMNLRLDDHFRVKLSPGASHDGAIYALEAYGAYAFAPWLEVQGGRFLVPFNGVHAWAFPSDSFFEPYSRENSPKPFLYPPWWDEGAMVSGRIPFGPEDEHELFYAGYVINGFDEQGLDGIHKRTIGDNNKNKTLGGRVSGTFRLGDETQVTVGAAGMTGKYDAFDRRSFYAAEGDLEFSSGPFSVYVEAFYRPSEISGTVVENPAATVVDVAYMSGFKLRPQIRILPELAFFVQLDQLVVRQPPRSFGKFSVLELDNESFAIQTAVAGLKYDVTPHLRLMIEAGQFFRDSDLGPDIRYLAFSTLFYF